MSNISIELIDHMGTDKRVAEVARVSFANDNLDLPNELSEKDESLIKFLARGLTVKEYGSLIDEVFNGTKNRTEALRLIDHIKNQATHWTPFAHTSFTIKCKAPIPIRTQLFKHTIGLVANEESRRYISGTPELYIPEQFRAKPDGSIKQGSGDIHPSNDSWLTFYSRQCNDAIKVYETMIADGVCPEQARFVLPQGMMVNWVWTGNLVSLANVYNKRSDLHAQKEVQEFASILDEIMSPLMPVSWAALTRTKI